MKSIVAMSLVLLAAGCWMDDFEAATNQNQRALDAYERGDLAETYAQANTAQAEAQRAVEAFYADRGRFPTSLDELVPGYLERVPRNTDGTPLSYSPETGVVTN